MKNLLIYESIFDSLDELTNEEAGILFKALNNFRKGEEVVLNDRYLKGLWAGIKPNLEKLQQNYEKKVALNKENGKKGGRPPESDKKKADSTKNNKKQESIIEAVVTSEPKIEKSKSTEENLLDMLEANIIDDNNEVVIENTKKDNIASDVSFKNFKVPTKFIENGLWNRIMTGNKGGQMLGLVNRLSKQNNQKTFELELDLINESLKNQVIV